MKVTKCRYKTPIIKVMSDVRETVTSGYLLAKERSCVIQKTYTSMLELMQTRMPHFNPELATVLCRKVGRMVGSKGNVDSFLLAGPCYTGKTRTLDMIMSYLHLLDILNMDKPNEQKLYRTRACVYRTGVSYASKKITDKEKEVFYKEVKEKLGPVYDTDGDGRRYQMEGPATGIYVIIDEMDSGGQTFCEFILKELMDKATQLKSKKQFIRVLIACNIGGENITQHCIQHPFSVAETRSIVFDVFQQQFSHKITSHISKNNIFAFPPLTEEQVGNIVQSMFQTYLTEELPKGTDLTIGGLVLSAKLWDYNKNTGLRPVRKTICDICCALIENVCAWDVDGAGPVPGKLTLNMGPKPGELGFYDGDTPIAAREQVCAIQLNTISTVEQTKLLCPLPDARAISDVTTMSTKGDLLPLIQQQMLADTAELVPRAVLPYHSTYHPETTELMIYDKLEDVATGACRLVSNMNLAKMLCSALCHVKQETIHNKTELQQLKKEVTKLRSDVAIFTKSKNQERRRNSIFDAMRSRNFVLSYWVNNRKRRKKFRYKTTAKSVVYRQVMKFCEDHAVSLS
jgi:hypothetical protein